MSRVKYDKNGIRMGGRPQPPYGLRNGRMHEVKYQGLTIQISWHQFMDTIVARFFGPKYTEVFKVAHPEESRSDFFKRVRVKVHEILDPQFKDAYSQMQELLGDHERKARLYDDIKADELELAHKEYMKYRG